MSETIKLVIAVPSSGQNPFAFTYSLAGLMAYLAAGLRSRPDATLEVSLDGQCSSVIQSNRELLAGRALANGRTHLLFLDHDMTFNPKAVDVLFSRRHPVVVTNYRIKRQPPGLPEFVAVDLAGRRVGLTAESAALQEVTYSGFGVSLIETRVFAALGRPWFQPRFIPEAGSYTTEDLPFFEQVRAAGFPVYLDHDASKMVGHVGDYEWRWDDAALPADAKPAAPAGVG